MHVHGIGWHRWDGQRWARDEKGYAGRAVRSVLRTALQASLKLDNENKDAAKGYAATSTNAHPPQG
jgi:putative DNA primase/helicase